MPKLQKSVEYAWPALAIGTISILLVLTQFPLYTDELQWKAIGSRIFLDGFRLTYLFPACDVGFDLGVPISWFPSRVFDALLYQNAADPRHIRYSGILGYLSIWGMVGLIFHKQTSISLAKSLVLAFSLTSFGLLFPLLVLNRPEQGILVPFLVVICVYVYRKDGAPLPTAVAWLAAVLLTLAAWLMLGAHLKSFVLLPALLLAGWVIIRRPLPFAGLAAASLFGFWETFQLWSTRIDCPQVPFLQSVFANLSVSPRMLLTEPLRFLRQLAGNVLAADQYLLRGLISDNQQSEWFPANSLGWLALPSNALLIVAFLFMVTYLAGVCLRFLRQAVGARTMSGSDDAMVLLLGLGLLAFSAYQTTKNFYETSFVFPILVVATALVSVPIRNSLRGARGQVAILVAIGAAFLGQASVIALAASNLSAWQTSEANRAQHVSRVPALAKACDISIGPTSPPLIVDDVSYSALWANPRPVFSPYFYGWWATGVDPQSVVLNRRLAGQISACSAVPEIYAARTVHDREDPGYCCVKF